MNHIEEVAARIVDEYVNRWKTGGGKHVNVRSFEQIYAENNITPIELESTLVRNLPKLNK